MEKRNEGIISIRPHYAHAILDGIKTIELRRRIPKLSMGTKLWIYATLPLGAVIGIVTVKQIVKGAPDEIWKQFGHAACITRSDYDIYFDGAKEAIGLILSEVRSDIQHVKIEKLRSLRNGFRPPQVITWINKQESMSLHTMTDLR